MSLDRKDDAELRRSASGRASALRYTCDSQHTGIIISREATTGPRSNEFADSTGFYVRDLWERHSFNGEPQA